MDDQTRDLLFYVLLALMLAALVALVFLDADAADQEQVFLPIVVNASKWGPLPTPAPTMDPDPPGPTYPPPVTPLPDCNDPIGPEPWQCQLQTAWAATQTAAATMEPGGE
jgi:hypothetical protein